MSIKWANAVRANMERGKNPVVRYLTYKRLGRLTIAEQQDLTTEMIARLYERVVQLERPA